MGPITFAAYEYLDPGWEADQSKGRHIRRTDAYQRGFLSRDTGPHNRHNYFVYQEGIPSATEFNFSYPPRQTPHDFLVDPDCSAMHDYDTFIPHDSHELPANMHRKDVLGKFRWEWVVNGRTMRWDDRPARASGPTVSYT